MKRTRESQTTPSLSSTPSDPVSGFGRFPFRPITSLPSVGSSLAGRILDPVTGGLVLYVAGCGSVGTQAASRVYSTTTVFKQAFPRA